MSNSKRYPVSLTLIALDLPRTVKQLIAVVLDIHMCVLATWIAFYLRLDEFVNIEGPFLTPALVSMVLVIPIFIVSGLYRTIFRYVGRAVFKTIAIAITVYGLIYLTIVMALGIEGTPRTLGIIQPLVLFILVAASRLLVGFWLGERYQTPDKANSPANAVIYGAGSAGRQLRESLRYSGDFNVICFVDDDTAIHGQTMAAIPIYSPTRLRDLSAAGEVDIVLLAMPSISRSRKSKIIQNLATLSLTIRSLPALADIAHGRVRIDDLRELDIDDLLGRDQVDPNRELMDKQIAGRIVLVSGAGGSIGSELCRQVISLNPDTLIILDQSEFALFEIHSELKRRIDEVALIQPVELVPVLCSVEDKSRVQFVLGTYNPDIIFHAAAYKHVPLVESNPISGIKNNIFGTMVIARAAAEAKVAEFVLVSTDKAVRPTSVMGATKRVTEMILQAFDATETLVTRYSMVRFGNVLESSGSVIPLFKEQIRSGGPVTVTHSEVTRFFMTIPEAAQLVIQASGLASGGDVFVLDMGQPIKIIDLAERMIQLSGLSVRDLDQPDGDIEIQITGLRDGEKLYEELLIGNNPESTKHPKILRARESFVQWNELQNDIDLLNESLSSNDAPSCIHLLGQIVRDFKPAPS
jgi:FlaA1/EpsC-like NDP-sugar epimerase